MVRYQWGIFWANMNPAAGTEQAGSIPVLVISSEVVNEVLPVVTIVSITSFKPGRRVYPIEVLLNGKDSQLAEDSIVMAHQIRSISKERLGQQCGYIDSEQIRQSIRTAVKLYLDME
ncbi:type II toxin-antitoxin system PemK/MazF family toxin [Paenibacillus alkalitolerans]|uniref:type II toxin-antitoxin system PemK/MazF family toxin n=1 Tax=Paenibacillus alkalitolerans TaxID=2799335 RepID=UPI0018F6B685|nr:type II toxin-antitoxin system PemK/MazF family toxin [Paenibacillus alkalitolerans]